MTTEQRTITCCVLEDEPLALHLMKSYVERTPFLELVATYLDGERLRQDIEEKGLSFDLLFSDIEMPGINGIDLSKCMPATTKVIFTTAYSRYAIEGFKVNALDYLLKPISYEDFMAAARKALDYFVREDILRQAESQHRMIQVKSDRQMVNIPCDDIVRIEGLGDYLKIFTTGGNVVLTLMRMKNIEGLLPADDFVRVHKSHIVRLSAVTSYNNNSLNIDGVEIPVSRRYRKIGKGSEEVDD